LTDTYTLSLHDALPIVLTHEIMNSIAPISSLAATIREDIQGYVDKKASVPASDMEDYLMGISTIEKRSEGLTTFVSDFRSLAHIPMPKFTAIKIKDLFDQVEKLFQNQLKSNQILLTKSIVPDDLLLFADSSLIEQV